MAYDAHQRNIPKQSKTTTTKPTPFKSNTIFPPADGSITLIFLGFIPWKKCLLPTTRDAQISQP